jgi:ComF family protein
LENAASLAEYLMAQEGQGWRAARRAGWTLLGLFFQGGCRACSGRVSSPLLARLCAACWDSLPLLKGTRCPCCGLPLPPLAWKAGTRVSCRDCRRLRPRFHRAWALFAFSGWMREMIHDFKFNSATSLRRPLVRCLELGYRQAGWSGPHDFLAHVPTSPEALKQRGFDHCADLAEGLSGRLGIQWLPALEKEPGLRRQSGLSRAQRLVNTRTAFRLRKDARLGGRRVLLVDDVLTTGATAQACASLLLAAGAARVDVLTLARSV